MLRVWQRAGKLLWQHPRLLGPLVVSSLLTSALVLFQKAATHFLLHHWIVGHSFFGLYVPEPDATHAFVRTGMIVLLPFTLAMRVVIVSVYLAGFVCTTQMVCTNSTEFGPALHRLMSLLRRIPVRAALATLLTLLTTLALTSFTIELGRLAFLATPNTPALHTYLVRPLLSLLVDLPLIPLWIFLALLVEEDEALLHRAHPLHVSIHQRSGSANSNM